MLYAYDDLQKDLQNEKNVFSIGKSVFGRDILAVIKGRGIPHALIFGGIHARESVTSDVVVNLLKRYDNDSDAVCFVPLVNPDGAMLVKYGAKSADESFLKFLLKINGGDDFSTWKANGRAVDLNVNFDADFGKGRSNVFLPSSENFVGRYPFSEPETRALKNLTEKYRFTSSMCLHTKGNLIYYGYNKLKCYKNYVKMFRDETGFPIENSVGSTGGFKDWFLKKRFGFSITVELGDDALTHPVSREYTAEFCKILEKTPKILAKIGDEIWMKNLCDGQSNSQKRQNLSTKFR